MNRVAPALEVMARLDQLNETKPIWKTSWSKGWSKPTDRLTVTERSHFHVMTILQAVGPEGPISPNGANFRT